MPKTSPIVWVIAIVVIAALFNIGGTGDFLKGLTTTNEVISDGTTEVCVYDGSTMTIGPVEKRYSPGTSLTEPYHRLYVNGIDDGLKADSATKSVSFNDNIEIIYMENDTNYYATQQKFTVPCKKTFTSAQLATDDEYKVILNSSVSMTLFNDDDANKNSNTAVDVVGLSSTVSPVLRLQFGSKGGYSPEGVVYLVTKHNTTLFDTSEVSASTNDLAGFKKCDTPTIASNELSASGFGLTTYCFDGVQGDNTQSAEITIELSDSHATNIYGNDTVFYLYDEDWYQNSDTSKMEFGTEDNNDADVGMLSEPSVTYYGSTGN